jgi:FAD-dependent oxidoreductase family protein
VDTTGFASCFEQVYDVAVIGEGYAAFAAATELRAGGQRVLMIGARGDLLWESGRAFALEAGQSGEARWTDWLTKLRAAGGEKGGLVDGALSEIVATNQLEQQGIETLYYSTPVAVEKDSAGRVESVVLATKSGLRRVAARRWVDATETGLLLKLCGRAVRPRAADRQRFTLFFQQDRWAQDGPVEIDGEDLVLRPTLWPTERALCVTIDGGERFFRSALLPAVARAQEALGEGISRAQVTHGSFRSLPVYAGRPETPDMPENVACAAPALCEGKACTLADRFELGLRAARPLAEAPAAEAHRSALDGSLPDIAATETLQRDIAIIGGGTGGVLAAIAAGRQFGGQGGHVVCVEPLGILGGIGTAGGIHHYYFGVPGGLQQEIDEKVAEVSCEYGEALKCPTGFHPIAKAMVLEKMVLEAGVDVRYGESLYDARVSDRRIQVGMVAGADGPVRIEAGGWIDGTGDGDLCARAGAEFSFGREGDALPHAYTQSSGVLMNREGTPRMRGVNYDAGWVDPTDVEDLTRARRTGIAQYARESWDNYSRPTYIAPAIGLRQARQVRTDKVMTLDDLVMRRSYDDTVGFTGCHYDNHAADYQMESDESLFWTWLCQGWSTRLACEIAYGMLVPVGLENVWIASRCLGVSQDAHHCMRMERDMQRIGEVAGYAAVLAIQNGVPAREIPLKELQGRLEQTGALRVPEDGQTHLYGGVLQSDEFRAAPEAEMIEASFDALDRGEASGLLWHLYRAREKVAADVRKRLDNPDDRVSWLAAGVSAIWGQPAAEPRLIRAIETREYGFESGKDDDGKDLPEPMNHRRLVPNWMTAVGLLRVCGTSACLDALRGLAREEALSVDAREAIALTVERLAHRELVTGADAAPVLDALLAGEPVGATALPQRFVGALAEASIRGEAAPERLASADHATAEDHLWQLHLSIAKARAAAGLEIHDGARDYLADSRAVVRNAFAALDRGPA